ncbi:hypothetical protein FD29_GL000258 [Companilactobacillus mindensis DSM 14500]|uniref:Major facilitator superfamily (MFS) profile domain-containing protein n=1 Tax=Companilactobacillus mindensis DSM 14500 TaxID=1423770 RepID=A0A0R1QPF6_9LACO|nr:MFS transporter [Companilactobacillus mindensis]KRL44085.1 hypothetical protein FD29_GL000258 [Companilactobacillus mindensis DSM 14500]GEO79473.1 MFS transporter [Companilactobacillus mindensis]
MKKLLNNRVFLTITGADFFETIGTSLFNIILLIYAKSFVHANIMVSIVSVASVLPGVLGMLTGQIADRTADKRLWLIITKFIQGILYLVLAQLINRKQVFLLMIIILINVSSDLLGMYSSGLRMPIIQNKVPTDVQEQAVGINSGIATLMQVVGQAIGISFLAINHDYQMAGYLNALSFFIAGFVLLSGYRTLKLQPIAAPTRDFKKMLREIRVALEASSQIKAGKLLTSILLLNAVGASLDAIINLFLIDDESAVPFHFGVSILIINIVLVTGTILGSVLHTGFFQKLSFKLVMLLSIISLGLLFADLMFWKNFWIILITLGLSGFGMGQANPKIMASLLKVADADIVGSLSGLLDSLAVMSIPIGSIGLVLIYNLINSQTAYLVAIMLLIGCAFCLLLPNKKEPSLN